MNTRTRFGFGENSIESEKQIFFLNENLFIYLLVSGNENGKFNFHENIPVIQAFL